MYLSLYKGEMIYDVGECKTYREGMKLVPALGLVQVAANYYTEGTCSQGRRHFFAMRSIAPPLGHTLSHIKPP